jgi:hypothetical protein
LNIDLELDDEQMLLREIDPDDIKSDFDEIRALGRPSIDSYTIKSIELEFNDDLN